MKNYSFREVIETIVAIISILSAFGIGFSDSNVIKFISLGIIIGIVILFLGLNVFRKIKLNTTISNINVINESKKTCKRINVIMKIIQKN